MTTTVVLTTETWGPKLLFGYYKIINIDPHALLAPMTKTDRSPRLIVCNAISQPRITCVPRRDRGFTQQKPRPCSNARGPTTKKQRPHLAPPKLKRVETAPCGARVVEFPPPRLQCPAICACATHDTQRQSCDTSRLSGDDYVRCVGAPNASEALTMHCARVALFGVLFAASFRCHCLRRLEGRRFRCACIVSMWNCVISDLLEAHWVRGTRIAHGTIQLLRPIPRLSPTRRIVARGSKARCFQV